MCEMSVGLELSLITRQPFLSSLPGKQLENYLGHRNAEFLLLSALILLPDKKWEWVEDLIWRNFTLFLYSFVLILFLMWLFFFLLETLETLLTPVLHYWSQQHVKKTTHSSVFCDRAKNVVVVSCTKNYGNKKRNCVSSFPAIIFWLETPALYSLVSFTYWTLSELQNVFCSYWLLVWVEEEHSA